jgi:hypothetical protein
VRQLKMAGARPLVLGDKFARSLTSSSDSPFRGVSSSSRAFPVKLDVTGLAAGLERGTVEGLEEEGGGGGGSCTLIGPRFLAPR